MPETVQLSVDMVEVQDVAMDTSVPSLDKLVESGPRNRLAHAGGSKAKKLQTSLQTILKKTKRKIKTGHTKTKKKSDTDSEDELITASTKLTSETAGKSQVLTSGTVVNDNPVFQTVPPVDESDPSSHGELKIKIPRSIPGVACFTRLRPSRLRENAMNESLTVLKQLRRAHEEREDMEARKQIRRRKLQMAKGIGTGSDQQVPSSPNLAGLFTSASDQFGCKVYAVDGSDEEYSEAPKVVLRADGAAVDWENFLQANPMNIERLHSVTDFPLAPLREFWEEIAIPGLYIEVRNPFTNVPGAYWVAKIITFRGYKAFVKFEDFGRYPRNNHVTWISFCSDAPKHLGWCEENGKQLIPGKVLKTTKLTEDTRKRLKDLMKMPSIKRDHLIFIQKKVQEIGERFPWTHMITAVCPLDLKSFRLTRAVDSECNRIQLKFFINDDSSQLSRDGVWYDYRSSDLKTFMWAPTIGAELKGVSRHFRGFTLNRSEFPQYPSSEVKISKYMRLETVHPIYTDRIVGAVVVEKLKYGNFILRTNDADRKKRCHRVYHVTSPYVLPVGFAQSHGVQIEDVLDDAEAKYPIMNLQAMPPRPVHPFKVGDKMEAVYTRSSDFLGPVTVKQVAGHLLYLHFDSWSQRPTNYQWVDAAEGEIYPIGYCEMNQIDWKGNVELD